VPCGLIQYGASGFPFLNQEKTPVLFDYGGDGYVWCPDHFRIINMLGRYCGVYTRNKGQMAPRHQFVRVMGNIATMRHGGNGKRKFEEASQCYLKWLCRHMDRHDGSRVG
jgi:hypothetical protein